MFTVKKLVFVGLALFGLSIFAAAPDFVKMRSHYEKALPGGNTVVLTRIFEPLVRMPQSGTGPYHERYALLVDSSAYGRWVVEEECWGVLNPGSSKPSGCHSLGDEVHIKAFFKHLDTGEKLDVGMTKNPNDRNYNYALKFNGEEQDISIPDGQAIQFTGQPCSIVQRLASDRFKGGLLFLFTLHEASPNAAVGIYSYQAIYGDYRPTPDQIRSVEFSTLPTDCDFDASFGYPCTPNEQPLGKSGKMLVVPRPTEN
jgi:hypothetical protein